MKTRITQSFFWARVPGWPTTTARLNQPFQSQEWWPHWLFQVLLNRGRKSPSAHLSSNRSMETSIKITCSPWLLLFLPLDQLTSIIFPSRPVVSIPSRSKYVKTRHSTVRPTQGSIQTSTGESSHTSVVWISKMKWFIWRLPRRF